MSKTICICCRLLSSWRLSLDVRLYSVDLLFVVECAKAIWNPLYRVTKSNTSDKIRSFSIVVGTTGYSDISTFSRVAKKTRSLHRQAPDFPMASYSVLNLGVEACVHCRVLIPCCRVPSIQLFLSGFFDFLAIRSMCPVKLCGSKAHVLLFTKLCGGLSLKGRTICFLGKLVES